MKQVRYLYCGFFCSKYGKTRTGRQRWYCKECHSVFVNPINKTVHDFKHFIPVSYTHLTLPTICSV